MNIQTPLKRLILRAVLRKVIADGMRSIDQRLEEYGPLEPNRFSLKETNQRLAKWMERGRYRA